MKMDGYDGEFLSEEDILLIHDKLAAASEDNETLGFIDNTGALFQGAVNSIFASFFGQDIYPTIEEKACRLGYNIVTTHCFKNVNKRTGLMAMIMTYQINGMEISLSDEELFEAITTIAGNNDEQTWDYFKLKIIGNVSKKKN